MSYYRNNYSAYPRRPTYAGFNPPQYTRYPPMPTAVTTRTAHYVRRPTRHEQIIGVRSKMKRGRAGNRGHYWSHLGEKYGSKLGSFLGRNIIGRVAKWFGSGAYGQTHGGHGGKMAPIPPTFSGGSKSDYVEICHREYVKDIFSSAVAGDLKVESFFVNAGDVLTFPWLSKIAGQSFQQYRMDGCIFEFKSMSADALNSTNTALGTVISSVNYDSTDAVPTNRQQLENTDWSQSTKPSQSFYVPLECARHQTFAGGLLYTRQNLTPPAGADRKMYDLGRVDIASIGCQGADVNLGSLYVSYKVRLFKTVSFAPLIQAGFLNFISVDTVAVAGANYFGATRTVLANTMGAVVVNNKITIPRNRLVAGSIYLLIMTWHGASTANTIPTITLAGGSATNYAAFSVNGTSLTAGSVSNTGTTAPILMVQYAIAMGATATSDVTITLSVGTIPAAVSKVDVQLIERNGDPSF